MGLEALVNKLKKLFYASFLGEIYFRLLLLWDKHVNTQEELLDLTTQPIVIEAQKALYEKGIKKLKHKMKELTEARTKEEQENILSDIDDILSLSRNESENSVKRQQVLKAMHVRKGTDLKTDLDKAKMMQDRIEDMHKYRKAVEFRNLTRELRKARQANNIELSKELEEKWNELRKQQ